MASLRFIVLGEGLIFSAVIEKLKTSGHAVVAALPTVDPKQTRDGQASSRIARIGAIIADQPCDVLLSIANPYVLPPAVLGLPSLAAINYHNAPLPGYAGLRATAWAIANGEAMHGISWHLMEPRIDTGAVLVRRVFSLEADETTASLNARCTVQALGSLDELITMLSERRLAGVAQDLTRRSYYGRRDVAPRAGCLDWSRPMQDIVQLVRACDWGPGVNDFGLGKILLADADPAFVLMAEAEPGPASAPVGTILHAEGAAITVACADGTVRLMLDRAPGVAAGAVLPSPCLHEVAADLADYDRSLHDERKNLALYRSAALAALGDAGDNARGVIATGGGLDEFLAAVSRVLGANTICAFESDGGMLRLRHDWLPIRAANGAPDDSLSPCRDIHLRVPDLARLADWPRSARVRIFRHGVPHDVPPGTIAFTPDGAIHFCGTAATATALAASMAPATLGSPDLADDTIPTRILAAARRHPHAIAITDNGEETTYAALARTAVSIAGRLRAAGVRAEDGVGILLPNGGGFVAAALGAMLAGAAYVPLDPASPPARLRVELEGAGITHVITSHASALEDWGGTAAILQLDDIARDDPSGVRPRLSLDACAYRIFTSGSTGRPKAVEVTHDSLENLVRHCCDALPLGPNDRVTALARTTFDASVADVWPILTVGGTLLVPPARILLDQERLLGWLASESATCAFVPTAIAERLLSMPRPEGIALHTLLTGGDVLRCRPPAALPYRLINSYGPTENTVASLWSIVAPGPDRPTIGRPISGVTAQVVNDAGQPVADGEIGELLLGGKQIARGYFGQPELTAQRFVADRHGERVYRTGDRVRVGPDGDFQFHGRLDDQVQILGIRVEPGEIEVALLSDCRVAQAVCLPLRSGMDVGGLIAFVVPRDASTDASVLAAALRDMLKARLAAHMIPRRIRIETHLPYQASGKLDRVALASRGVEDNAGRDAVEGAWRRALPQARDGQTGDFWKIGGDSLAAVSLLVELETLTGVRISTGSFLANPTLDGLRRLLDHVPGGNAVELRAGRSPPIVIWYGVTGDLEAHQHLLARLPDRRIIGITSPGLHDQARLPQSIEQAVAIGLNEIEELIGDERPVLLGYSFGGSLAFEAGRQLAARGTMPLFVALLGTQPPLALVSRQAQLTYLAARLPRYVWRVLRGRHRMQVPWRAIPAEVLRMLGLRNSAPVLPHWAHEAIVQAHFRMGERYRPAWSALPVHLLRERGEKDEISLRRHLRSDLSDLGWSEWNDLPIRVHWVEGDHANMMTDTVGDIARILDREIDAAMPSERAHLDIVDEQAIVLVDAVYDEHASPRLWVADDDCASSAVDLLVR